MSFLARDDLEKIGFKRLGRDVQVSGLASFHNPAAIEIGDYARIDDYCCLSAGKSGIYIGRRVHVAVYSSIMGAERIELRDYAGLSARVSIYSSNDDYSGDTMTNPTVPEAYRRVTSAPVVLQEHVIVGAGTVILPGVTMHRGSGVGALSLVRSDCEALGMYFGAPARRVGRRSPNMFHLQSELEAHEQSAPKH